MKKLSLLIALFIFNLAIFSACAQAPKGQSNDANKAILQLDQNTQKYIQKSLKSIELSVQRMQEISAVKVHLKPLVYTALESTKELKALRELLNQSLIELADGSKSVEKILIAGGKANKINNAIQVALDNINLKLEELPNLYIHGVRIESREIDKLNENLFLSVKGEDWAKESFGTSDAFSAICLLHQLELEILLSEEQILSFFEANLGQKDLRFDRFDVVVEPSSSDVKLGESYEARIILGTFSSEADFSIRVDDEDLVIKDGIAIYKNNPKTKGTQKFTASITFMNKLTGETQNVKKEFRYEVK